MKELDRAVERLYEVFRVYPLRPVIDSCPHCKLEESEARLHARSLRELGWQDLEDYAFKAMTTFGDVDDFKHFIPRLLELCLPVDAAWPFEPDVVLEKLAYAEWKSWPRPESEAVRAFVDAWAAHVEERVTRDPETAWSRDDLAWARREHGFDEGPR